MAFQSPPWPPTLDAEATRFGEWLAATKYAGTDTLGWVRWGSDYRQHRADGLSHELAVAVIGGAIDAIRAGRQPAARPATGRFDVPWPPTLDADAKTFGDSLRTLYRDVGGRADVDILGWVRWSSDYRILRGNGVPHDLALLRIANTIRTIWGKPIVPEPTPPRHGQLTGRLRYAIGGLWEDDTGPVLPMFLHFMEAFSAWCHGKQAEVKAQCERAAAAGYQGIRTLDVLGYYEGGWYGHEVTPIAFMSDGWKNNRVSRRVEATPNYYDQKRVFVEMLHGLGLRIMDDRGDLNSWPGSAKLEHMRRNGQLYASMGDVGREVLAGVWVCNESWQNGVETPEEAARMLSAFLSGAGWLPDSRGLSWGTNDPTWQTPGSGELPDDLIAWSIDPATVGTMHGNRVPNEHIIGHYLGYGWYDDDLKRRGKRTWNTEPVGGGLGVSVGQVNDVELLCGIAAEALMTGQAWTHMSGNGVFWNGPIDDHPGFLEIPRLLKWLPKDLHLFDVIGHAGIRFRGTRILAAIDDPPTRADYAIHTRTGRFVMNVYGQHAPLPFERACAECKVIDVVGDRVQSDGARAVGDRFVEPYRHCRLVVGKLA